MRGDQDLLVQLALEHRDLAQSSRRLRRDGVTSPIDAVRSAAVDIVDHELAHRLLVYPLLRRDARGRELFAERREEQLLLADRLRHVLALFGAAAPARDDVAAAVRGLDDQLVEHTDREEIITFPHLRHLAVRSELNELGRLRAAIRRKVRQQLRAEAPPVVDGTWATARWRELPDLLHLSEELVIVLPELVPPRANAS